MVLLKKILKKNFNEKTFFQKKLFLYIRGCEKMKNLTFSRDRFSHSSKVIFSSCLKKKVCMVIFLQHFTGVLQRGKDY